VYPHNEFSGSDGDTSAATVSVSVSVNGGYDYASISTPISVLPNRRILNLVPESGPSKGMTALTVSGIALHTAFDTPKRLAHLVLDGTNGGLPPIRSALEGGCIAYLEEEVVPMENLVSLELWKLKPLFWIQQRYHA
jgi:hypothetical protein